MRSKKDEPAARPAARSEDEIVIPSLKETEEVSEGGANVTHGNPGGEPAS
jgi:hypothetical protein